MELGYPFRTNPDETPRTVTYSYRNGLLTGVTGWASVSYQPNGAIAAVVHNGGVNETWTADPNGMPRPRAITVSRGTTQLWASGDYAFDGAGNIRQTGTLQYQYDAYGRLAAWREGTLTGAHRTESFLYDVFGNRLETTVMECEPGSNPLFPSCYTSSVVSRAVSGTTNRYAGSADSPVAYDAAGNVLVDSGRTFTYDAVNMPTTVVAGGRTFIYLYTVDDERVAAVERLANGSNKVTWTLRGFGNQLLSVRDGDTWKEDQIWRGSSLAGILTPGGVKRHYSLDHLGSPRVITDNLGNLLGTQTFTPFGEGGTLDSGTLQFTGHERDRASLGGGTVNLPDYAHARLLDTGAGRFLSVDPVLASAELRRPQSWNRYSYVMNNPVNMVDADGKAATLVTAGIGALTGAGFQIGINLISGDDWDKDVVKEMAIGAGLGLTGVGLAKVADKGYDAYKTAKVLQLANKATAGLKGSTAAELMPQAMKALTTTSANGATKAAMFEKMATQISKLTNGAWSAARMAGPNGSHVFFGKAGEALVINAQGQVFRGQLGKAVKVTKDAVEIAWDQMRLIK